MHYFEEASVVRLTCGVCFLEAEVGSSLRLGVVSNRHGGSVARLVKDILSRAFEHPASAWPAVPLQLPAESATGPP
ncbi:MAG TPA: hypothetical protein VNW90_26425 [Acetobacteraceae bacterium]|jgi:hypothetical protein|nr:hypothetical protein [Acetobacteraceae bacterium]